MYSQSKSGKDTNKIEHLRSLMYAARNRYRETHESNRPSSESTLKFRAIPVR